MVAYSSEHEAASWNEISIWLEMELSFIESKVASISGLYYISN